MSQLPLTIPAPSSSALSPTLRSQINSALLQSNAIPKIQAALLHECQATGFITALRARCLELLRSGECSSYGELMGAVMEEVRGDGFGEGGGGTGKEKENGINGVGTGAGKDKDKEKAVEEGGRLRVPRRVVEEGVSVVKSALDGCVVFGEDGKD